MSEVKVIIKDEVITVETSSNNQVSNTCIESTDGQKEIICG